MEMPDGLEDKEELSVSLKWWYEKLCATLEKYQFNSHKFRGVYL